LRILIVHPGASYSTHDVWRGVTGSLERYGAQLIHFALDSRLDVAHHYLALAYKRAKRNDPEVPRPTAADVLYWASAWTIERALRMQPDWVLIISAMYVHPDVVVMLKRAGMRVAILFTESPYDDEPQMRLAPVADVCWVNERSSVARFREVQPNAHYWQHALDPQTHRPDADAGVQGHDVVFVGTGFIERCNLLAGVDWAGIDLGLYGSWSLLGSRNKLRQYIAGDVVPNNVTAALYRAAKIGLNIHRTSMGFGRYAPHYEGAESLNPRCYELAACGSFFLSDYRAELEDVFGDTVPTFNTSEELAEMTRYYLDHDDEREAIAKRLPALVAEHTFDRRVCEMLSVLERCT